MTKLQLIEGYYDARDEGTGQWFQRWSTMVDQNGLVYMRGELGDPYERFDSLDGLLEHVGELRQLRRWEWYAIRYEWCEGMDLFRFTPSDNPEAEHLNLYPQLPTNLARCFCVFRTLFKDSGGFELRESERIAKESEARDVLQASLYQPH